MSRILHNITLRTEVIRSVANGNDVHGVACANNISHQHAHRLMVKYGCVKRWIPPKENEALEQWRKTK